MGNPVIAELEYYDGIKTRTTEVPLAFRWIFDQPIPEYSIQKVMVGTVQVEDVKVAFALDSGSLEYDRFIVLWVQESDGWERQWTIAFPVTIRGHTFEFVNIDRFGNSVEIRQSNALPVGKGLPAPDIQANTIDGNSFSLLGQRDKWVLVDFWSTRCGPCVREIPYLKQARKSYPFTTLAMVSIADDSNEDAQKFVDRKGMKWIHLAERSSSQGEPGPIHQLYQVSRWPTTFLVNREGVVVAKDEDLRGDNLLQTLGRHIH